MHFDNIEIGTSDFRTLIHEAHGNGISVEPVPYYFNRLPDRPRWHKDNVAISNKSDIIEVYFCDPIYLNQYPNWIRGCNSIGNIHPTLMKYCSMEHITSAVVECITMSMLMDRHNITSVGYMKIDTEGHDPIIVNDLLDSGFPLPDKLQFESNVLTTPEAYDKLVKRLSQFYNVKQLEFDTVCERKK